MTSISQVTQALENSVSYSRGHRNCEASLTSGTLFSQWQCGQVAVPEDRRPRAGPRLEQSDSRDGTAGVRELAPQECAEPAGLTALPRYFWFCTDTRLLPVSGLLFSSSASCAATSSVGPRPAAPRGRQEAGCPCPPCSCQRLCSDPPRLWNERCHVTSPAAPPSSLPSSST